jgi:hypothetical protein
MNNSTPPNTPHFQTIFGGPEPYTQHIWALKPGVFVVAAPEDGGGVIIHGHAFTADMTRPPHVIFEPEAAIELSDVLRAAAADVQARRQQVEANRQR